MGAVTRAPAHLVGQSIGLPGRHLLLIVRVPKHAAQGGGVLQTEERPAVITVPKNRSGAAGVEDLPQAACAHREAPGTSNRMLRIKEAEHLLQASWESPHLPGWRGVPQSQDVSSTCSWGGLCTPISPKASPHLLYLSPGMGDPISIR